MSIQYGDLPCKRTREMFPKPVFGYTLSIHYEELRDACRENGVDHNILRIWESLRKAARKRNA